MGNCCKNVKIIICSLSMTFLQDFLEILKHSLQNFEKIMNTCFIDTTYTLYYTTRIKKSYFHVV